eukprot:1049693-Amorphochlora_amoeboformis.AAC.1
MDFLWVMRERVGGLSRDFSLDFLLDRLLGLRRLRRGDCWFCEYVVGASADSSAAVVPCDLGAVASICDLDASIVPCGWAADFVCSGCADAVGFGLGVVEKFGFGSVDVDRGVGFALGVVVVDCEADAVVTVALDCEVDAVVVGFGLGAAQDFQECGLGTVVDDGGLAMDDPGGLDTVEMNGALGFGLGVDMNGVLGFGLGVLIVGWNLGAVNLGAVVVDIVSGPVVILDSVSGGVVESDLDTVVGGFVIGVAVLDSGFDAGSGLGWACSAETSSRVERNMSLSFWGVFLKLRGVSTYGLFGSGYACLDEIIW